MHVGERPYVLSPSGPANLSERPLSVDAMSSVLDDLLSAEDRRTLLDVGAVEREILLPEAPGDRFLLVAARGGDDIWIELRRQRGMATGHVQAPAPPVDAPPAQDQPSHRPRMAPSHPQIPQPAAQDIAAPPAPEADLSTSATAGRRTPAGRDPLSANVLPLARSPIRTEGPRNTATPSPKHLGIGRLLRTASARGASSLYLIAESRPSIRIDDEILPLESEQPLGTAEVEALILEMAPSGSREALRGGSSAEWLCDLPDVGRVRCLSFRDQRGPGAVFRLIPTRLISADQLGLSRDIQALCGEREGLILVAGPRLSGKSTLISAFVDLINRTRSDYLISLETEIKFVHENRKAMVSQREVRGDPDVMLTGVRAALRENPDVLVVDDLKTPDLVGLALDAADSGHLVIGSVTAHTTTAAIARLIDTSSYERQTQVALALSEALRGAVAQVLLRKAGGGRVAARELLFNTPSVAALIAEGKIAQLPLAIDSGRKYGMVPMNDALLAFVQSGAIEAREAYRKAYDRVAFLEQLRREGIDTSFVERLA
ncbi:MAG: ATPase, T2SS/T4P/T4SS family [Acidobacteria bacterium]|nr:ATPase, T2SS/T4P/T4SS family [Acidobacteriota bacterium]